MRTLRLAAQWTPEARMSVIKTFTFIHNPSISHLDSLRFACAGRAGGSTTKAVSQGGGESHVAAIRERSDNEAAVDAHELVAVAEVAGALADGHVVNGFVPVKPQL
jgi:hypothetical protein